jgi:hypothetical protein
MHKTVHYFGEAELLSSSMGLPTTEEDKLIDVERALVYPVQDPTALKPQWH